MIKKERLQELIEQNAIVYYVANNEICQLELTYKHNIYLTVEGYYICLYGNKGLQIYGDKLFESKAEAEDAEWHYEIDSSRTEYFAPPTWEQFEREHKPYHFISKSGLRETIYIFDKNVKNKLLSAGSKIFGKPTKENYIKACEYAKALFLGEKNVKN